jgi:O-antigen/teichoic acid export membrane protein
MSTSITKNAAFMTAASIGQKVVAFAYFTLIARNIGAENTGKYFFALSFTTVFVVFVDLGLTNVLVREAAKFRDKMQSYFSTVISVKLILGILSYVGAIVAINLLGYPIETKQLVYLSAITMLFDSLHLSIYGILRAIGDLKFEAISIVGSQLVTLVMGTVFLYLGYPLIFLILAFTVPSALNVCYATIVLYKKYHISIRPHYDPRIFKYIGKIAIPFALAAVFARVYSYIDSILLSKIAGDVQVGWYSIAYKITFAFQFVPLALVAAVYPRFSEHFLHNKKRLAFVFVQSVKYLLIVALPITVGIGVLAPDIVLSLYTVEYFNSILPLQILLAGLVFSYVSFPIGAFLNACNRQTTQTKIVGFVLFVNILLNLTMIPKYGVVGAAIAAMVGNVLLTVLGYLIVPKITKINHVFLLSTLFRVAISAGIMGVLVSFVNISYHFTVAILTGIIIYPIMLFVTKAITKRQLREAWLMMKR